MRAGASQGPMEDDADASTLACDAALQDATCFVQDANGISPSMNGEQTACGG